MNYRLLELIESMDASDGSDEKLFDKDVAKRLTAEKEWEFESEPTRCHLLRQIPCFQTLLAGALC